MPFHDKIYHAPATRGDVAGVALKASIALDEVIRALNTIAEGKIDLLDGSIKTLKKLSSDLDEQFDTLSGWYAKDE